MKRILGIHQNRKKGYHSLQTEMNFLETDTCAFFLNSPRSFTTKPLSDDEISLFKNHTKNPSLLLPHGSYLINLVNKDSKHINLLNSELHKCDQLNIKLYNVHPGSDTLKLGLNTSINNVASTINSLTTNVTIVIENMAGDGNKIGYTFEHLRMIIDRVENKERVGVCLDTCHLFAANYDIRTFEKFDDVMKEFDNVVGVKYLKAMHLNDSKTEMGSRRDRHAVLGKGMIGLEAFRFVMRGKWFENAVLIVETPDEVNRRGEIKMLRDFENK